MYSLSAKSKLHDKEFPSISRPYIIGCIGLENLKFVKDIGHCSVNFDLKLKTAYDILKPNVYDPKLTELLRFLLENKSRLNYSTSTNLNDAVFFCYRGLLTVISTSPYEFREPWKLAVMLFKGNIYLCLRDTEKKRQKNKNASEYEQQATVGGHKFEQYIFSDTPDTDPNPHKPLDELAEFNCMFETKLNAHTIVYGAEIDGVACDTGNIKAPPKDATPDQIIEYLNKCEFVEAKTNLHFDIDPGVIRTFQRHKSCKWWCQSYFAGINRIICGFKNKETIVEKLEVRTLKDLEEMTTCWNPRVCMNFLDSFLSYVKTCLEHVIKRKYGAEALNNIQDLELVTLLLEWEPFRPVNMSENWNHDEDEILFKEFRDSFDTHTDRKDKSRQLKPIFENDSGGSSGRSHDHRKDRRSNFNRYQPYARRY